MAWGVGSAGVVVVVPRRLQTLAQRNAGEAVAAAGVVWRVSTRSGTVNHAARIVRTSLAAGTDAFPAPDLPVPVPAGRRAFGKIRTGAAGVALGGTLRASFGRHAV